MNTLKLIKCAPLLLLACMGAAHADVVVVVSAQSKVATLTKDQVSELFLGGSKEFPGGGTALLVSTTGPVRDEFYSKVLGKDAAQVKAVWSRLIFSGKGTAPREIGDVGEVKKLVSANPSTIGFIDKSAVDASVKVVYAP